MYKIIVTRRQGHDFFFSLALVLSYSFWLLPLDARGDGGTVRLSEQIGAYRVTVFTAPTPVQAGAVDISVLVQDAVTGELATDVPIWITLTPAGQRNGPLRAVATRQAATNKLFRAFTFELPAPGRWRVEIEMAGTGGSARSQFDLVVGEPPPRWLELWLWIGWPVAPILLFCVHQILAWRERQPAPDSFSARKYQRG